MKISVQQKRRPVQLAAVATMSDPCRQKSADPCLITEKQLLEYYLLLGEKIITFWAARDQIHTKYSSVHQKDTPSYGLTSGQLGISFKKLPTETLATYRTQF